MMQPTMKLRWLQYTAGESPYNAPHIIPGTNIAYVLQQWWEDYGASSTPEPYGEWRDIPIEVENGT